MFLRKATEPSYRVGAIPNRDSPPPIRLRKPSASQGASKITAEGSRPRPALLPRPTTSRQKHPAPCIRPAIPNIASKSRRCLPRFSVDPRNSWTRTRQECSGLQFGTNSPTELLSIATCLFAT